DTARHRARTVAGAESPRELPVSCKPARIAHRVGLLDVSRAPAVFKVVDALRTHEGILYSPEIDPDMGELMDEQGTAVQELEPVHAFPAVCRCPRFVTFRGKRIGG